MATATSVYECMFLLDTTKVAGDVPAAVAQIHGILERNQVEILASRPWEERRLSYTIKKQKKGLYYLTYFKSDSKNLRPIEQDVALSELIIRYLVLKIEPKMVDTMLAIARDEHALALHNVADDPTDPTSGDGGGDDRRGPRRGPRRSEEDKD